jgi:hypothetical protein
MHTPSPSPYTLEPRGVFIPDPGCWYCVNAPRYAHRHWRETEPAPRPRWEPNLIWRALFWIYGNG